MSTPPSQPSLENLPCFRIEERKKHLWRMDQKALEHRGIRIQDERRLFLLQPNIIIPKQLKKYKCERKSEREKRFGLAKHV
jgi:hypothetical protein